MTQVNNLSLQPSILENADHSTTKKFETLKKVGIVVAAVAAVALVTIGVLGVLAATSVVALPVAALAAGLGIGASFLAVGIGVYVGSKFTNDERAERGNQAKAAAQREAAATMIQKSYRGHLARVDLANKKAEPTTEPRPERPEPTPEPRMPTTEPRVPTTEPQLTKES